MPVNSNQVYPTDTGDNFNLPALNFTQFFFALRSVGPSASLLLHYK